MEAIALIADPDRTESGWTIAPLGGGASNANYRVVRDGGEYVLRVPARHQARFGVTHAAGLAVQSAAAAARVAPPVTAYRAPEGVCLVPLVGGTPLDGELLREPGTLERVGALLAALHRAPAVDVAWSPFADIERYARIAADEGLAPPADAGELLHVGRRIERVFAGLGDAPVLCHNDLQPQNLILDGDRQWLVDWEYAGMGSRHFDLGNLACNADLSEAELDVMLRSYGGQVRLEVARARAMLMRVVSGIREAYWAVVAEPVLDNDWDYRAWAESFFDRCRRTAQSVAFDDWLELAART